MLPDIPSSEITPESLYRNRREFLKTAAAALAAGMTLRGSVHAQETLHTTRRMVTTSDAQTGLDAATSYNNFYELGPEKDAPRKNAARFHPAPWSVAIEGECGKPGVYTLEDIVKPHPLEERVYRMRCVEGWSMVIPWDGFPLGDLLKRFEPTGNAKFVEFTSVLRPEELPGQRARPLPILPWPYREGLRMDEAMHPLTILAVGLYGQTLPNQNGAPLRLVVPWKYGFKGIKSIVKIRFAAAQPTTTWQVSEPLLYAFYSNVNPGPTASIFRDQSTERRIGEFLMRKTLPFNGYESEVAPLYAGMDLRRNF